MQIRLSGVRSVSETPRSPSELPLAERLTAIPRSILHRFADRLHDVLIHVSSQGGSAAEPALARVAVRSQRGSPLTVTAGGACPESAARVAMTRVRRLLRREAGKRRALRARETAA